MMIDFSAAIQRHNMKIKGVIQVGAHHGQEYDYYVKCRIEPIVFIEPLAEAFKILKEKFSNSTNVFLFNCACGDYETKAKMYVDTNNKGMSSSLLKPKEHLVEYPTIPFDKEELVPVRRLDNLPIHRSLFNLLVMDVQGTELMVLLGAPETLEHIDYIYTEINTKELYEGGVFLHELDAFLNQFDRVETKEVPHKGWGDAIYIRKTKKNNV